MDSAIIVAAGISTRFNLSGGQGNKMDVLLNGKPIYYHSVKVFLEMGFEVVLVTDKDIEIPNVKIVKGGLNRSKSVYNGLLETTGKYVFVHDAARPLLTKSMIGKLLNERYPGDGAYLARWVTDSLMKVEKGKEISIERDLYFTTETPQVFRREILLEAFSKTDKAYSDEVSMVLDVFPKASLMPVFHTQSNDKITYLDDVHRVRQLARGKYKIGHSFDIHRLEKGRKLILGGVEIPSEVGLLGHSDADVILHVITEAILGALGLGDLGTNFPDTNEEYKNISSVVLLNKALDEMKERNYTISNMDIMLYLEKPKLFEYRFEILKNLKKLLDDNAGVVNFKVTTTEKIGPIGQSEAMAAEATLLLVEVYGDDC